LVALISLLEGLAYRFHSAKSSSIPDARLNHKWKPNSQEIHTEWISDNPEFPQPYLHVYNKQGWLEDYDIQLNKPANTYRIFYVGDSFVEGTVPMNQSVPGIVKDYLRDKFAKSGEKFEVINTGTTSYSPVIYYILIRYFIAPYSPDLIVVNVDMTDNFDDWVYRQSLIVDEQGDPLAVAPVNIFRATGYAWKNLSIVNKAQVFLYEKSSLCKLIYDIYKKFKKSEKIQVLPDQIMQRGPQNWAWVRYEWDKETQENVKFTMDILKRIAQYCQNNHIKLLFTASPHYQQLTIGKDGRRVWSIRPHEEIRKIARELKIPYLDSIAFLDPHIKDSQQTEYYYKNDMHFNPRGYALWARAHIQALLDPDNKLLPEFAYLIKSQE
jgi:hypothetical protein